MLARAKLVQARLRSLGGQRWMRWLVTGLILALSTIVLGGMVLRSWPTLVGYRWQLRLWPLAVACAAYALDLLLAVFAWSQIMRGLAGAIPFREHFRIYGLTLVAGRIPGAPWHIAGRAVLYSRHNVSKRITGVASGMEIMLIVVAGLMSGLLIWPSVQGKVQLPWQGVVSVLVLGLALLHPKAIKTALKLLGRADTTVNVKYWEMLALLGLYVLIWAVGGIVLHAVILILYPLPLTTLPRVIGAWGLSGSVAVMAFFSPSGLGVREITLSALLALLLPGGLAVVIAILMRIILTAAELVSALVATRL